MSGYRCAVSSSSSGRGKARAWRVVSGGNAVEASAPRAPGSPGKPCPRQSAAHPVRSARTARAVREPDLPGGAGTQDLSQTFLNWRFEPFGCTSRSSPPTFWRAATVPLRNQSTTSRVSSCTRFWTAL